MSEDSASVPLKTPIPESLPGIPPPPARQRVLIVDDDMHIRRILGMHLETNFDVLTACNGMEGHEIALSWQPDLILTDIRMPVKSGLELCRELRASESTKDVPIVMLTATTDQDTKLDCLEAGATEFLSKPCSAAELTLRVRNLIQMYLQQRELTAHKLRLENALIELQQKEELLVRQEKLASLGRMSAGLIHEINNPLNYVLQGVHLLQKQTHDLPKDVSAEFSEVLQDIDEGVSRVSRIVQDLRTFTGTGNRSTYQPADIAHAVATAAKYFSGTWKSGFQLTIEVPTGLYIFGSMNQMVQVLTNLVKNAIDAMQAKTYADGQSPSFLVRGMRVEDRIFLTLRDNGIGIPQEVRQRIFDPFFTTKDVGKGMGLGLSICHSFLTEHGASIDLQSTPGEFTEFTLNLPAYEDGMPLGSHSQAA